MKDIVPLNEIVYDERASNGVFCAHPYEGHPHGCPNWPQCPNDEDRFTLQELKDIEAKYDKFAIVEEFDLKAHAQAMKLKHPTWSERQCRCLLYWQNGVRKRLLTKAMDFLFKSNRSSILLSIPEASGINVFATMEKAGIIIEKHPNTVKKVMLVWNYKEIASLANLLTKEADTK
jgi:hypothetical protein